MWSVVTIFCVFQMFQLTEASLPWLQTSPKRGSTDDSPQFLSGNYIPAVMHVIFHLSDSLKYEVRPDPGQTSTTTTTTTIKPTPAHRPGYFAPEKPQGIASTWASLGPAWSFSWGKIQETKEDETNQKNTLPKDIELFGAGPSDLLHQINRLEDVDTIDDDEDDRIEKFSVNYDETVNLDYLKQKRRNPPTRAFVNILSLYDLLNKEAKEQGLNKFNGYSDKMLQELSPTSNWNSIDQLKFVLSKVLIKRNIKKDNITQKIKQLLSELENPESYISSAIKYIPALQFS